MIFHKTLTNIRTKHGYTHEEFAAVLGCDAALIVELESNKQKVDFAFVTNLRDKLGLHNAPITEVERTALMEGLNIWLQAISYGDMDKAAALKPQLEKGARESYSPSTVNYYDLFAANYYWMTGDMGAHNETMAALELRKDEFGARHQYYYHRLLGARAFMNHKYSEALRAYVTAKKLDKNSEWGSVGFYYSISKCLSDIGYTTKAIEHLKKARQLAQRDKSYDNRLNSRFDVAIDGHLACNLAKIGKVEEAHSILDKRLNIEMRTGKGSESHGATHFYIGLAYLQAKKYCDALKNFEIALQHTSEKGYYYCDALYNKARALFYVGKISEGICNIDNALSLSSNKVLTVLLEALKYSKLTSVPESLSYMENIIMPKLIEYEQYEEAAEYFKLLSDEYCEKDNHLVALKYSNAALDVYKQLCEERIKGGV